MLPVIKVENLSKQYRLGLVGSETFKEDAVRFWKKITRKEDPFIHMGETNDRTIVGKSNFVWSLKDINFEVNQGEVLGIIGRNGAGKSTLLKILSRVTAPTTGYVKAKGRIASLLEVGTGFHPELTGRENIFLNGAILGMRKHEIKSKLDEIIAFADVERYIDTPVKRYSSGMYVRLAFAVAAHLESEILIVDEVLAVGDAEFQKKCLGKMSEVSKGQGRTVLFVSHNMSSMRELCTKAIYLKNGELVSEGNPHDLITEYLGSISNQSFINVQINKEYNFRRGSGDFIFKEVIGFENEYDFSDEIKLTFTIERCKSLKENPFFYFALKNQKNNDLSLISEKVQINFNNLDVVNFEYIIPSNTIFPGNYSTYINLFDSVAHSYDLLEDVFYLKIFSTKTFDVLGFDPLNPIAIGRLVGKYNL